MGFWSKFVTFFTPPPVVKVDEVKKAKVIKEAVKEATVELNKFEKPIESTPKRARNKGRYVADDKSTPNVNEPWVGGKAPKRRKKNVKKK